MDFILGDGEVAIEVKGRSRVEGHGELRILPVGDFLDELWGGGIFGP